MDEPFSEQLHERSEVARLLAATQPWVRWVSIWGFVICGFMLFAALIGGVMGAVGGSPEMAILMVVYPIAAAVYFFPSLHLFRYATRIRAYVADRTEANLEAALEAQRAFWKLAGILLAVSLVLACIFLVAMLMFGAFMSARSF